MDFERVEPAMMIWLSRSRDSRCYLMPCGSWQGAYHWDVIAFFRATYHDPSAPPRTFPITRAISVPIRDLYSNVDAVKAAA